MKHIVLMHNTKKHHDFEKNFHEVLQDYDYEIVYTSSISDSLKRIRLQIEKARFYIVGGDGTMHAMLQELVHSIHDVVLIPLGTGNDFIRTISKDNDPVSLLKKSIYLSSTPIDTIQINDRYYLNSACFGVDSIIGNRVHDHSSHPIGLKKNSYVSSIIKHVFNYDFNEVTLISNNEVLYQGRMTVCALTNGQYYGGGFRITPSADICDGYMNVRILEKVPKAKLPYMIVKLALEKLEGHPLIHDFKLTEATLYCDNEGNLDGEEYTRTRYDFKVLPQSLNMVLYDK